MNQPQLHSTIFVAATLVIVDTQFAALMAIVCAAGWLVIGRLR